MNSAHYFQRYSQRENVVTNNTLLLFSRLYTHNPYSFEAFLNECLDDSLDVGVSFVQQKRSAGKGGIPDGLIIQNSFKVVIETKLYQNYDRKQLERHLSAFEDENQKVLLLLSPSRPQSDFIKKVEKDVRKFNKTQRQNVRFVSTTFETLIAHFENTLSDFDFQMNELVEDFKAFCQEEELLPTAPYLMRVRTAGWSLPENLEFDLYYETEQTVQQHQYMGLYSEKSVKAIGKIENIITADFDGTQLIIHKSLFSVTESQKSRIIGVIPRALENNDWDIATEHVFYLVEKFHPTDFKKLTKYPIQKTKYFDLRRVLNLTELPKVEEIAEMLRTKDW